MIVQAPLYDPKGLVLYKHASQSCWAKGGRGMKRGTYLSAGRQSNTHAKPSCSCLSCGAA